MASSEMSGTTSSSTRRSASSRIVQRCHPSGGFVQASATTNACSFGPSFGRAPGRGRSRNEASSPSSTNRRRRRSKVATPIRSCPAIASSVFSSAASSNAWARLTIRTEAVRFRARPSNSCRSSSVNVTRYRFATIPASAKDRDHGVRLPVASSVAVY
jgi:hypothetical protein